MMIQLPRCFSRRLVVSKHQREAFLLPVVQRVTNIFSDHDFVLDALSGSYQWVGASKANFAEG